MRHARSKRGDYSLLWASAGRLGSRFIGAVSYRALQDKVSAFGCSLTMSELQGRTAIETLDSLESRLQRIEWHLSGSDEVEEVLQNVVTQGKDYTVQARLARLESNLGKLSSRSPVVRQLLQLRQYFP